MRNRKIYTDEFLDKFNWIEIQEFYNRGKTWRELIKEFKLSNSLVSHATKIGVLKTKNKSDSIKDSLKKNPRTHSQETKDKISKARIKYLSENPDKVPYLINHSSKESYPERYFTDVFEKENINVIKDFRIGLYELDFCILDKKINIEIDGDQHYLDKRIVDSDVRRNLYLEEQGWKIIRIKWSDYQKLEDKKEFIQKLKLQL